MDTPELQALVIDALEDIKGRDIETIDTRALSALFDCIVVATGDSNRQVRSLARNVADRVRAAGGDVISIEGEDNGEWVLVDLGNIVVHVLQPAVRNYYALEELWASTPGSRQRYLKGKALAEPRPAK